MALALSFLVAATLNGSRPPDLPEKYPQQQKPPTILNNFKLRESPMVMISI
ncbi:MAG: hypothetical protein ACN4GW_13975 [Desulforhopalus sp.]